MLHYPEEARGNLSPALVPRLVLGGILLIAAAGKLWHPAGLPDFISNSFFLPDNINQSFISALIFLEILAGLMLVLGLLPRLTLGLSTVLMLGFLGVNAWGIASGDTSCNCFGQIALTHLQALGIDLFMIGLAGTIYCKLRGLKPLPCGWHGRMASISLVLVLLVVSLPLNSAPAAASQIVHQEASPVVSNDNDFCPTCNQNSKSITPFGSQGTSPDTGTPQHAYSPFDQKEESAVTDQFIPGQVLIKFKPEAMQPTARGSVSQPNPEAVKRMASTFQATGLQAVFPGSATVTTRSTTPEDRNRAALSRWFTAKIPEGTDVVETVRKLKTDPAVQAVEPDYLRRPTALPDVTTDPRYGEQWHLNATHAPEAWQFLSDHGINPGGSRDVVVAVIDTGVDYTHPDLAANIWTNSAEFNGTPGVDDDNNGFVDDIHGANVVSNQHSGDPQDDHGHGTHVAGIIAAQANNGTGGVGIAYNTQVMPIKAAQYSGVLSTTDIAEAIYYAVEKGADVINMSFGGYSRSQLEEDALAVAFGQAVLVAAAGNDHKVNKPCPFGIDMYPAAYNWVLGVMASTQGGSLAGFSNFDCTPHDTHEYELMAPGVDILSTLPGGQYAAWDGTSMAAPVVSGIAALVRSYRPDKDIYSSRYIMGQLASQGANAYNALTIAPQPELNYLEHWLFDTTAQGATDDADGIVDAGETVDLAVVIRNHWGKAEDVNVTLSARAAGAVQDDPYVTFAASTVNYGAIGNFGWDDNGLIYDAEGAITGVYSPFRFTVSPNTPNDHVIPFLLTMTCLNGYDAGDPNNPYSFTGRFNLMVQRGRELPRIISENMTMTKDYYWIIPDQTLIEANVSVTIEAGTQVQFWTANPSDPYSQDARTFLQVEGSLLVLGTADEPVELFQEALFPDYAVDIRRAGDGVVEIYYTRVMNPRIQDANVVDHCYFSQEVHTWLRYSNGMWLTSGQPLVDASLTTNSIFHKLGGASWESGALPVNRTPEVCLFDSDVMLLYPSTAKNNVFLNNIRTNPMAVSRAFVRGSSPGQFQNNAILNTWWDPNVDHWMQFDAGGTSRGSYFYINDNFWGTASTTIIDASIYDYNDNFNIGQYIYKPILTTPAETTYPFVWKVDISQDGQNVTRLGPGDATFTVTFNRDMDASVQPAISFGPDVPVTDYTVHPVNGGWQDARTWAGTFNINPITGDGYQLMRIAGPARAADDPWLVLGDDSGRFRFEIITSGTEAMNLQATGSEGKVDLMWTQNDFDLLAGYNLYRSTTIDGSYTRINTNIIPAAQKAYIDNNVQPGQPYFYKFSVIKTDMTESKFSNIASATPTDTIPPVISHTPVGSAAPGMGLQIYADVTDNVSVVSVTLKYRHIGETDYQSREMVKTTGNRYSATLEGALVTAPGIEYYIQASDGVSIVRSGQADLPYRINVVDAPQVTGITPNQGPISGGTAVTISGSNFKTGAAVTFSGAAADSIIVTGASQITCNTPPHLPGVVDVVVTNPDAASGTLLRAFTYESNQASVSLPDASADSGAIIEIPVNVENAQGLLAAQLTIQFNSSVLTARGARTGTLTPGFSIEANTAVAGEVRLSLAGATATSGSAVLAYIEFLVNGAAGSSTDLLLSAVSCNGGAIPVSLDNGTFIVRQFNSISGHITYYEASRPVSGVTLDLTGNQNFSQTSDVTGAYTISNIISGNYTLTPGKTDDTSAITSYDASFILRAAVGSITLSGQQQKAADVDGSGDINAMDASYVLQRAAQLIDLPFPGVGKIWDFVPASRTYQPLNSNQANQDFTAVLIGDVSGNWGEARTRTERSTTGTAEISLPEIPGLSAGQATIPLRLNLANAQLYGADIVVVYDPTIASAISITRGALSENFSLAVNLNRPGEIRLAMAGAAPITAGGDLANLTFNITGSPGNTVPLQISSAQLNEGEISSQTGSGNIIIAGQRILGGISKIANIRAAPFAYENWQITVSGQYRGWEAGHGPPPVTRSDYVVLDDSGAIYVTGRSSLRYPADLGKPVEMNGTIKLKNGTAYIDRTGG